MIYVEEAHVSVGGKALCKVSNGKDGMVVSVVRNMCGKARKGS